MQYKVVLGENYKDTWKVVEKKLREKGKNPLLIRTHDFIDVVKTKMNILTFIHKFYRGEIKPTYDTLVFLGLIPEWAAQIIDSIADNNYDGENDFDIIVIGNFKKEDLNIPAPYKYSGFVEGKKELFKTISKKIEEIKDKTIITANPEKDEILEPIERFNFLPFQVIGTEYAKMDLTRPFLTKDGGLVCIGSRFFNVEHAIEMGFEAKCFNFGMLGKVNVFYMFQPKWQQKHIELLKKVKEIENVIRKETDLEPSSYAKNYPYTKLSRLRAKAWRNLLTFEKLVLPVLPDYVAMYEPNIQLFEAAVLDDSIVEAVQKNVFELYTINDSELKI